MSEPLIIRFPSAGRVHCNAVGGKGASLIDMARAGFPVPPGGVLTTAFFTPWFQEIKATESWKKILTASADDQAELGLALHDNARTLAMAPASRDALNALLAELGSADKELRLAVRSSSPDEDLASASFAGSYETLLGVRPCDVEDAVRACFASGFHPRVFSYKREHGFDISDPRIAVIVQQQIRSEVSGVAFSLNPVTNDYDEIVVNANWGLGTSVVDGRVSPDNFIVSRIDRTVTSESAGDKRVSSWVDAEGGTVERANDRATEPCLTHPQLRELGDMICRIEHLFEDPIDIEWAYAGGTLHVLQARPITTYVPLPEQMITRPGERRQLYGDAALSKGMTTNSAISRLGLDNMERMFTSILESWVGPIKRGGPPNKVLFFFAGGRMYINYSGILWLASPAMLAKSAAATDSLMADTMASVDAERYRASSRPPWVSIRILWLIPRALWNLRRFFWNLLQALMLPERAHRNYQRSVSALASGLRDQLQADTDTAPARSLSEASMSRALFDIVMPALIAGIMPAGPIVRGRGETATSLADKLATGAPGNVVVEMGIALHRLARLLDRSDIDDLDRMAERIEERRMPATFLDAWDEFLSTYGWRGPNEMDLASPRYADDPRLALRQMTGMVVDDEQYGPEAAHRRQRAERTRAFDQLMVRVGPLRRVLLRRSYRRIELFAGTRDTPKHLIVLFNYALRKQALAAGERLVQAGRLDKPEDVFDLTFDELDAASRDTALDLRAIREPRADFRRKLDARVTTFPAMIDSRGRILRPPPRNQAPGLLCGMAVSPGLVRGPVKILHNPHDKRVEKGDVLVAYTTDPGWTPLFVNAAAIVLEVGGVLQHGAVVAREFGKPCVVGIDRVTERLCDGQQVEVDGAAGTVRLLPGESAG